MVRFFVHDGSVYLEPHWCHRKDLPDLLKAPGYAAAQAVQAGADHAVYAVKHYNPETDKLEEVSIYFPPVSLDDAAFEERTRNTYDAYPGCVILAYHKR